MPSYSLNLDSPAWDELDQFALLACQSYNFGNASDWFGSFRGGFFGMRSRFHGIQRHYFEVHAWIPAPRILADAEYNLSTALFHMDSAVECMVFAINALGNSISPSSFRDVTDDRALRRVSPVDVLGEATRPPLPGYSTYFPRFQAHLQSRGFTINQVAEQHDVSKHRQTIFQGGQSRMDPRSGFFESLGLGPDDQSRWMFAPMQEILLDPNPKAARADRLTQPPGGKLTFEDLAEDLSRCLSGSAKCALADARQTISLPVPAFRTDG